MKLRILIVEDNENNILLLGDILRHYGHDVLEARDGKAGVEMAIAHLPDLIFMDMQMPVMNGFDAIKALREDTRTRHIKIVGVTSFAMSGDKDRVMQAGADEYISKPINTRELPGLIERLFGERGPP